MECPTKKGIIGIHAVKGKQGFISTKPLDALQRDRERERHRNNPWNYWRLCMMKVKSFLHSSSKKRKKKKKFWLRVRGSGKQQQQLKQRSFRRYWAQVSIRIAAVWSKRLEEEPPPPYQLTHFNQDSSRKKVPWLPLLLLLTIYAVQCCCCCSYHLSLTLHVRLCQGFFWKKTSSSLVNAWFH